MAEFVLEIMEHFDDGDFKTISNEDLKAVEEGFSEKVDNINNLFNEAFSTLDEQPKENLPKQQRVYLNKILNTFKNKHLTLQFFLAKYNKLVVKEKMLLKAYLEKCNELKLTKDELEIVTKEKDQYKEELEKSSKGKELVTNVSEESKKKYAQVLVKFKNKAKAIDEKHGKLSPARILTFHDALTTEKVIKDIYNNDDLKELEGMFNKWKSDIDIIVPDKKLVEELKKKKKP